MEMLFGNANFIDNIVASIIRPPRSSSYSDSDLGPQFQIMRGITVQRVDLNVLNSRGQMLKCTLYLPRTNDTRKCCIYLHGNAGSRIEGVQYLHYFVANNIALFTMDFSGCGKSDGEIVTLGLAEQNDLNSAIIFLDEIFKFPNYIIWGRSMGAVTALLYQANSHLHPQSSKKISTLILDSPFESFRQLCIDLGKQKFAIPNFILNMFVDLVQKKILAKTNFDVISINLKQPVQNIETPALYLYSFGDSLINHKHSLQLIESHGKNINQRVVESLIFNGDHNDLRSDDDIQRIFSFIQKNSRMTNTISKPTQPILREVHNNSQQIPVQHQRFHRNSTKADRNNQNFQLTESFRLKQNLSRDETNINVKKQTQSTVRNPSINQIVHTKKSLKLDLVNCHQFVRQATSPLTLDKDSKKVNNLIREQSPSTRINVLSQPYINMMNQSKAQTRPSSCIYQSIKPQKEEMNIRRINQTISSEFVSPTNQRFSQNRVF